MLNTYSPDTEIPLLQVKWVVGQTLLVEVADLTDCMATATTEYSD